MRQFIVGFLVLVGICGVVSRTGGEITSGPGQHSKSGLLESIGNQQVVLVNGNAKHYLCLKKPGEADELKKHIGSWIKLEYTQTNWDSVGYPDVHSLKARVLYDAMKPFPLKAQALLNAPEILFGEKFTITAKFVNQSKQLIHLEGRGGCAWLKRKGKFPNTISIRVANGDATLLPMYDKHPIAPESACDIDRECVNLLLPGKYELFVESPAVNGIKALTPPVDFAVLVPPGKSLEAMLLERMAKATPGAQSGIAWVLWRDFNNHAGMTRLIEIMDAQTNPHYYSAGVIAVAEGEKAITPFLKAIRKETQGYNIQYWCEQAAQSTCREKLFRALLQEKKKVHYEKAKDGPVPISHLVAKHLLYYLDDELAFPWSAGVEEREKMTQAVIDTLNTNPKAFKLFTQPPFHPDTIDGVVRNRLDEGGS